MRICFCHLGRENLGIEYLSAVLKAEGHEVFLAYDPGLFGINDNVLYFPWLERVFERDKALLKRIEAMRPDIVAFSVYTGTYQWAARMAGRIKGSIDTRTVFGGIHATLVPERVAREPFCDYCIVGEGEGALLELLRELERGGRGKEIRNIFPNPLRPPISDLDSLPLPDKSIFEDEINYRDDYMIMTSRGCPFHCTYCCESHWNRIYKGRFFRRRSVGSVMEELRVMKKRYNFREVMFNDPIFFTDRAWLQDLMERYRKEINVPFRCFGKVSYIDEGLVELLEWGGCYAIEFGFQTSNEALRRLVLNRKESNEEYRMAFSILERHGIRYDLDHMFGLPGEKEEDYREAARLYGQLRHLNRIKCHNLTYFPGLEIVEIARDRGILTDADVDRIQSGTMKGDFFHINPVNGDLTRRKLKAFQVLYKVIPLLPERLLEWIVNGRSYRRIDRIPWGVIVLLQTLVAIKGRDYRFPLYIKYIILRLKRGIAWSRRGKELIRATILFLIIMGAVPAGSAIKDYGILHGLALALTGPAGFFLLRFFLHGRVNKDEGRQKGR